MLFLANLYFQLTAAMQRHVWAEVGKLDSQTADLVLEELVRSAVDAGAGTTRCETHAHIIASLSSISVRGKLFAKLRKASSLISDTILFSDSISLGHHQSFSTTYEVFGRKPALE